MLPTAASQAEEGRKAQGRLSYRHDRPIIAKLWATNCNFFCIQFCSLGAMHHRIHRHRKLQYDNVYLTCSKKLTGSCSLVYHTEQTKN